MDSTKDDDEPKICTVFSSDVTSSIFDTIAFTSSKKEDSESSLPPPPPPPQSSSNINKLDDNSQNNTSSLFPLPISSTQLEYEEDSHEHGDYSVQVQSSSMSSTNEENDKTPIVETKDIVQQNSTQSISNLMDRLSLATTEMEFKSIKSNDDKNSTDNNSSNNKADEGSFLEDTLEDTLTLPTMANVLFADAPDVPFPVNVRVGTSFVQDSFNTTEKRQPSSNLFQTTMPTPPPVGIQKPPLANNDLLTAVPFYASDEIYDAWIPSDETSKILLSLSTTKGETIDSATVSLTMPGIVHEEEMNDKVAINMSRIFGEAEASRRKILTVDSVTQDDNGIRELIKLGCYRSAINLTKRLLTLYGQGPGKIGHFSKHSPHSLQLWYTRIALLVRIREFSLADSEVEAFKDFENPDMYYEFYPEFSIQNPEFTFEEFAGTRGSIVPFHFRLLAAEIPQYMRKINVTFDKLTHILTIVETILSNITKGRSEDGNPLAAIDSERQEKQIKVWKKRQLRVLTSLANAAIFSKDFSGAVHYLLKLLENDVEHEMQLKSSLGRLYLQFGDINAAQKYFTLAAELSNANSESDRVETLVDSGLLAIGQNNYLEAFNFFSEALIIQPENFMLTNNMAVCLVYLGKVKEALSLMGTSVKQNTPQLLQENVILNLSTIYELENSDGSKKNALLKLISEYKGDGINLNSLKMPNLV